MESAIADWNDKKVFKRTAYYEKYQFKASLKDNEGILLQSRLIKNRELALIALRDFLHINSVSDTLTDLSKLADFCIDYSIKSLLSFSDIKKSVTYEVLKRNLIIIGMGKLGGNELNISSDIDLIFLGKDSSLSDDGMRHDIENFLSRLLDFIYATSSEGFLYRVDMRLRPEGENGPLIMGIQNAIEYYKSRARKWELQAMIKKRLVWGSEELYQDFAIPLDNIVYRHHQPQSIIYDIKKIKNEIELNIRRKKLAFEIKQSPGGIRDIEFIIQFLQLISWNPLSRDKELEFNIGIGLAKYFPYNNP